MQEKRLKCLSLTSLLQLKGISCLFLIGGLVFDINVMIRPSQAFSDRIHQFVTHIHVHGDVLHRWGLDHKRIEQLKAVSEHIAPHYATRWHNIGTAFV